MHGAVTLFCLLLRESIIAWVGVDMRDPHTLKARYAIRVLGLSFQDNWPWSTRFLVQHTCTR